MNKIINIEKEYFLFLIGSHGGGILSPKSEADAPPPLPGLGPPALGDKTTYSHPAIFRK